MLSRCRGRGREHRDLGSDPAGIWREDEDAIAHEDRLLDIMRHQQDRFDRQASGRPQIHEVAAQSLAGEHVERGKRLIHQENGRIDDERARETDALAHAAGKFARIGAFKSIEADELDGRESPRACLLFRYALRVEPRLHVLKHRQPGKQGEGLKDHRDAVDGTIDD